MKRIILVLLALCIMCLGGCREDKEKKRHPAQSSEDILIITEDMGISMQTAQYISASLTELGYSSRIEYDAEDCKMMGKAKGVIVVGDAEWKENGLPTVRCTTRGKESVSANCLSPCLSSASIARAAVLLLPTAEHFTVISEAEGAADVQDACDLFDLSGIDYTVEALEGRAYGDAIISAAKKGCDGLILPRVTPGGLSIELSEYKTAVIAVGEGEPVRGALASFCVDTESLAAAAARLSVSLIEGKESDIYPDSYYRLCISKNAAEKFSVDISAVSEDFNAVIVE